MKRLIHHEDGAILNVMTIDLEKNSETKPHFNKDRDEILFVLEGEINLLFDYGKSKLISSRNTDSWHLIKANTTHQIECLTPTVKILEVIGGIYKDNSCIITEFKN
tara:strand:- start:250 stop:567 length:318 start_codon:yes stop_codon:yes gene_type:complete